MWVGRVAHPSIHPSHRSSVNDLERSVILIWIHGDGGGDGGCYETLQSGVRKVRSISDQTVAN